MPIFEYQCKKCGEVTEFLEKADNDENHKCQECGSTKMDKLVSTFSSKVEAGGSSSGSSSCPTGTCPFS